MMKQLFRSNHRPPVENRDAPRGLIMLAIALALLVLAIALFLTLPASVALSELRVPVVSALAGLTLAAIGNIAISLIQRQTTREAARTLTEPLDSLARAVDKLEEIHFYHEQGVEGIFSNRSAAMQRFLEEIEREERWIGIVGTSLLGALDPSNRSEEKQKLMELLLRKKRDNVRIDALLMHPAYGEFRERVENRGRAAVAKDIQRTLVELVEAPSTGGGGVHANGEERKTLYGLDNVKLYPGVVTAFAIFTKRAMLLNTSTLTGPVYDNVAIIIRDTADPNSIYKKFRACHFDEPWKSEKTITLTQELLQTLIKLNFAEDRYRFKEGGWPSTIVDESTTARQGARSKEVNAEGTIREAIT